MTRCHPVKSFFRFSTLLVATLCFSQLSLAQLLDCNGNDIEDLLEFDSDGDSIINACDNCSRYPNEDQQDTDNDGFGNACDADLDNNGFVTYDDLSNFSIAFNTNSAVADFDNSGYVNFNDLVSFKRLYNKTPGPGANPNDSDDDNDTVIDYEDNCPILYNPEQVDRDNDGEGDLCDETPTGTGINLENYGISWEAPSVVHILTRALFRADGSTVSNLNNSNFEVKENGLIVSPSEAFVHVEFADPLAINALNTVILVDITQSIEAADFPNIRDALKNIIRDPISSDSKLLPGQAIAIYTFDGTVNQLQALTADIPSLISAIDQINQGGLTTNLYGALLEAMDDWQNSFSLAEGMAFGNIIVITDGQDTSGLHLLADVRNAAATRAIYAISVGSESDTESLSQIANTLESIDNFDQIPAALNRASSWISDFIHEVYIISYASSKRTDTHTVSVEIVDNPLCDENDLNCTDEISGELSAQDFSDVTPELRLTGKALLEPGESALWQAETLWSNNAQNYHWDLEDFHNMVTLTVDSNDQSRAIVSISPTATYALANISVADLNYADLTKTISVRSGNGLVVKSGETNIGQLNFDWENTNTITLTAHFAEEIEFTPSFSWSMNNSNAALIVDGADNTSLDLDGNHITLTRAHPSSDQATSTLILNDATSGLSQSITITNHSMFIDYPYEIYASGLYNCASDIDGLTCWGNNDYGQTSPPALTNPYAIASGRQHVCALDDDGINCWGYNNQGQTDAPTLQNPSVIAAGHVNSCAIDDNGIQCWGYNTHGQTDIPSLSNPSTISIGGLHLCALDDTGMHCWGYDAFGETNVPTLSNPSTITTGYRHTCALDDTGVHCWGYNGQGQTDVPTLSNPSAIVAGNQHSCAIDDDGLQCWGDNSSGQSEVPNLTNVIEVSAGDKHTCALDDEGLHCWGSDDDGQISAPNIWGWL